jgi:hypothetical protein
MLALHFAFLMSRYAPAISTPDANGYWAQGSLLFGEGRTWFKTECDMQYVNMHWLVTPEGKYFSRYPPGLAVVVGLVWRVFGHEAGVLVNPVLATLSLLGLFFLTRRMLGPWWALAAAAALAVNPIFNQHAIWCFAHVAVTAPLVWGLFFLLRWSDGGKLRDAFVAGLILGCIPTIRYPEAIFALGIGTFLLVHLRARPKIWLHWLVAAAGALVPVVPLLVHNHMAFGAFYRTAYALTNEQTGFSWDYFRQHFLNYVRGLHAEGAGPYFLAGLVGMTAMCCLREWRRVGVLLALLTVPPALVYMAYYWGGRGGRGGGVGGMRFLVPTFAVYVLAGTWLLARATEKAPARLRYSAVAAVLLLQALWGAFHTGEGAARLRHQKRVLAVATDALEKHAKPGDVVLSGRQMLQHLDYVRKWKLADLGNLGPGRGGRFFGRDRDPDAPSPRQAEKDRLRAEKYEGLSAREREILMAGDLWTWAGGRKIYFVGAAEELKELPGPIFNSGHFRIVARVPLPEAPKTSSRTGRGGMRPPGRPGGVPGAGGRRPPGGRRFPGRGGFVGRRGFGSDLKEIVIAEWDYQPGSVSPSSSATPTRARLDERVRKLRVLLRRFFDSGRRPDYFWPPSRDRQLRQLMSQGKLKEADELLDRALADYRRGASGRPRRPQPPRRQ